MQVPAQRRSSVGEDAVEAPPQLPLTDGRYFACRRCRRVLSEAQWFTAGCVDCSDTMGVPDRDTLLDFATPHFHNFIGLIAPEQSWVARLIMKDRAQTNGIFAEKLSDDDTEEDAEEEGEDLYGGGQAYEAEDDEEDSGEKDAVAGVAPAALASAEASEGRDDAEALDDMAEATAAVAASSSTAPGDGDDAADDSAEAPAEAQEEDGNAPEAKRMKTEVADSSAAPYDGADA